MVGERVEVWEEERVEGLVGEPLGGPHFLIVSCALDKGKRCCKGETHSKSRLCGAGDAKPGSRGRDEEERGKGERFWIHERAERGEVEIVLCDPNGPERAGCHKRQLGTKVSQPKQRVDRLGNDLRHGIALRVRNRRRSVESCMRVALHIPPCSSIPHRSPQRNRLGKRIRKRLSPPSRIHNHNTPPPTVRRTRR